MSTALRIASVTQVLKDLLNNGLIDHDVTGDLGGNVNVTSWPPDKIETSVDKETTQLNIFMYQATYNQGWRNVGLPAFNQKGDRMANPPLAIDLHYLLTAYGSAELHTDIMLGYGMQLFHETPVLDREAIRRAIGAPSLLAMGGSPPVTPLPPSLQLLSRSGLAEQVEQIRITPETLSLEDISKLWAAFGVKYRPTVAYKATVVLIESSKSTKPGLPVKERNIYVRPFKQPVIEKVLSQSAPGNIAIENQKILHNYHLVLKGDQFLNEIVEVNIDGTKIAGSLSITNKEISFQLPAGLKAGVREVQVMHPVLMGSPPFVHSAVMSQGEAFILSPHIAGIAATVTGPDLKSGDISFTINPAIQKGQRMVLFLNEFDNSIDPAAYSFELAVSTSLPASNPTVKITNVKPATYLVRVQVDGAESPLDSAVNGQYNSPVVVIA